MVELSGVFVLDATALGALEAAHARAMKGGTSLQLTGARGTVRHMLRVAGLDTSPSYHEKVVDAVEAALAAGDAVREAGRGGVWTARRPPLP